MKNVQKYHTQKQKKKQKIYVRQKINCNIHIILYEETIVKFFWHSLGKQNIQDHRKAIGDILGYVLAYVVSPSFPRDPRF